MTFYLLPQDIIDLLFSFWSPCKEIKLLITKINHFDYIATTFTGIIGFINVADLRTHFCEEHFNRMGNALNLLWSMRPDGYCEHCKKNLCIKELKHNLKNCI